jgi:hypothetical protein
MKNLWKKIINSSKFKLFGIRDSESLPWYLLKIYLDKIVIITYDNKSTIEGKIIDINYSYEHDSYQIVLRSTYSNVNILTKNIRTLEFKKETKQLNCKLYPLLDHKLKIKLAGEHTMLVGEITNLSTENDEEYIDVEGKDECNVSYHRIINLKCVEHIENDTNYLNFIKQLCFYKFKIQVFENNGIPEYEGKIETIVNLSKDIEETHIKIVNPEKNDEIGLQVKEIRKIEKIHG